MCQLNTKHLDGTSNMDEVKSYDQELWKDPEQLNTTATNNTSAGIWFLFNLPEEASAETGIFGFPLEYWKANLIQN